MIPTLEMLILPNGFNYFVSHSPSPGQAYELRDRPVADPASA
jgi:hypothetical protein